MSTCIICKKEFIWIQHGKVIPETLPPIKFHYEEIEHRLRGNSLMGYNGIIVEDKFYRPCPMCFGEKR